MHSLSKRLENGLKCQFLLVRMWSIRVASVLVILVGFVFFSVFQSLRKVPEGSLEVELEATVELHLNV